MDGLYVSTIKTIAGYLEIINKYGFDENSNIFYRGQSQYHDKNNETEWNVSPSVFRNKDRDESDIYNLIMTECAHEIEKDATHIEVLCQMQHYGVPTRLLDITKNTLAALFFACVNSNGVINKDYDGIVYLLRAEKEYIKVYDSDTVSMLASIPRFCESDRDGIKKAARQSVKKHEQESDQISDFNKNDNAIVQRLLHEIRKEKPAFKEIMKPKHILNPCIVTPQKKNARIIRQDGAFVLFGLGYDDLAFSNEQSGISITKKIIVDKNSKDKISYELEHCGISLKTMYPEMYKVAEYLSRKKLSF